MKTTTMGGALLLTIAGAWSCGGGAQTVPLQHTASAPAATGHVEAKHTDEGNTNLKVNVDYLAPPQNVAPDARYYVVWAKPETKDAAPQNIGSLAVSGDRKGKLQTTTPMENFQLLITPEPSPNATQPTHDPVMQANVTR